MSGTQLEAWRGAFGDAYVERNAVSAEVLRARIAMWAAILRSLPGVRLEILRLPPGPLLLHGAALDSSPGPVRR